MSQPNPKFIQKLKWRAEVLAYDLLCLIMRPFPFSWISATGGWLVRKIGPLTSKQKVVLSGLRLAFPQASDAKIQELAKAQWDNTGRTFFEFPIMNRIKIFDKNSPVKVKGLEHLRQAFDEGKGFVIVTGHFANWEIMAAVLSQSGLPVHITYRRINNPYLDKRVRSQRAKYGVKLLVAKSQAKAARELLNALNNNQGIALMNDQKLNEGLEVPFFNAPAMTAPGPTRLALKTGAPLIPIYVRRNKARFEVTIYPPLEFSRNGARDIVTRNGVIAISQFIEARITEQPDQWFWSHKRWDRSRMSPSEHSDKG